MKHFKSLTAFLDYVQIPRPEHPMLYVLTVKKGDQLPPIRKSSPPIIGDFYSIILKKDTGCELTYGRTKYDFSNGVLIFLGPRQVLQWNDGDIVSQESFMITFHEDFLRGTKLAKQIKRYGFFSYSANESLHLSPKEEKQIESIVESIEVEYRNNQDKFSKEIIISQLSTLLRYADRFYERQFLNRKEINHNLVEQFYQLLTEYVEGGESEENGVPRIGLLADRMLVSQRYLSDTLKKETGKTSTEHLNLFLINEAKNALLEPKKSISEVSYELGFSYPSYFSRLFKKTEGISPKEYREMFSMN